MIYLQILVNGLVLGGLYACIAVGFSLVWGVLNVINILHGTFVVLGSYVAYFCYVRLGIHPYFSVAIAGAVLFALGYALQAGLINRVIGAPVLTTLVLTFGLDLILNNATLVAFSADYKTIQLAHPLGSKVIGGIVLPLDRVVAMLLALALTVMLYFVLARSRIGRAIVAVRMDAEAAALMGVNVKRVYAITFGIGALMAGAAGSLLALIFPISPLASTEYLSLAFVVCVLGGLGSILGAMVGGLALGIIQSFGALFIGPQHGLTVSFVLLILLLIFKPTGLMGKRGYE
ncbi:branched-chain amino acid ABC transporter permease [Aquabacter sp. L1I39]|uniref:branched-chain amino acid ABC transporter permease n=1 Tax=Aquabacter TaxID=45402 RepID=UPI001ADCCB5A|nr:MULTISPECIES: branched-chain amino acid ABC transporter permease [unclassified Aquabacter]MDE1570665.1 branched-chain amino acid ABC transporter permease [Aquabacter sp. P-9]QTL04112.1 branched-chain amino acid ABC transporter permease [Aquabacter sp. L1I39]